MVLLSLIKKLTQMSNSDSELLISLPSTNSHEEEDKLLDLRSIWEPKHDYMGIINLHKKKDKPLGLDTWKENKSEYDYMSKLMERMNSLQKEDKHKSIAYDPLSEYKPHLLHNPDTINRLHHPLSLREIELNVCHPLRFFELHGYI